MTDEEFDALAGLANRMADRAGAAALTYFRSARLTTDNKAGETGFDPVTAGDREAEAAMRALIAEERPEDGIFGEEHGRVEGTSGQTWILDPIDGTRAFITGLPTWGTLIALDDGEGGSLGMIDQPFTGERFLGVNGKGAWLSRHGGPPEVIKTRPCAELSEATFLTTDPFLFSEVEGPAFREIRAKSRLTRFGLDCYGYAMVALGQADLVVETDLAAYDIAGPAALVQAAGGVVTDWKGRDGRWGGRVIAAGDQRVHAEALEILSQIPQ
ncbi:MAG: histidinol-phosphatase [Pseudomonadota bacterium]